MEDGSLQRGPSPEILAIQEILEIPQSVEKGESDHFAAILDKLLGDLRF